MAKVSKSRSKGRGANADREVRGHGLDGRDVPAPRRCQRRAGADVRADVEESEGLLADGPPGPRREPGEHRLRKEEDLAVRPALQAYGCSASARRGARTSEARSRS